MEAILLSQIPVLYRVAQRYTLDASVAEDIVGQTLLKAVAGWTTFDRVNPRAWLIKILHNEYLGYIRGQKSRAKTVELLELDMESSADTLQLVMNRISADELIGLIDGLPTEYRLAVVFCDVEEMSYSEAAEILGIPVGTVRSRLFRGRKRLQEQFARGEG